MDRGIRAARSHFRLTSAACCIWIGFACGGNSKSSAHGAAAGTGGGPPANGGTNSSGAGGVGGSLSGGGSGGGVAATLDSLITVICSTFRSCCENEGLDIRPLVGCETAYLEQSPYKRFLDDGTVIVNEAAIAPCLEVYEQLGTTCGYDASILEMFASCADLFAGTLDVGETCSAGRQCRHPVGESTLCQKVSEDLGVEPETGTCQAVPHAAEDSTCDYSFSCVSPLGCIGDITLQTPLPDGRYCHYSDGLFCNLDAHVCQAALAQDAPCDPSDGTGAICQPELACVGGSCQPRKAMGEMCEGNECALGLLCLNGMCARTPIVSPQICAGEYH